MSDCYAVARASPRQADAGDTVTAELQRQNRSGLGRAALATPGSPPAVGPGPPQGESRRPAKVGRSRISDQSVEDFLANKIPENSQQYSKVTDITVFITIFRKRRKAVRTSQLPPAWHSASPLCFSARSPPPRPASPWGRLAEDTGGHQATWARFRC